MSKAFCQNLKTPNLQNFKPPKPQNLPTPKPPNLPTPKPQNPIASPAPYLPFGDLLDRLQDQGFTLGPDTHIQIAELLQRYAAAPERTSVDRLKHHLAALVAHSEAQQRLFYSIFDDYLRELEQEEWGLEEGGGGGDGPRPRRRYWRLLALLPLLGFGLLLLLPKPRPRPSTTTFQARPLSSQASQTWTFADAGQYPYPWYALAAPARPDSFRWDFGDGSSSRDSLATHAYTRPGRYRVRLAVWVDGDSLQKRDSIVVQPLPRLRVDFQHQETADGYELADRSYLYAGDSLYRPWDTLQQVRYRWWAEGLGTYSGPQVRLSVPPGLDTLRVWLVVSARWRDTAATDSALRVISRVQPPAFPSLRGYLVNPDLSDLMPETPGNPWLFLLLLAATISYFLYEFIRARQRKVALDEAPPRGPPLRQPLRLAEPALDLFQTRAFYAIARELRRRRSGEARKRPDVPRSVRHSARRGGFPHLVWQVQTQPSQYLLLIEQHSPEDHLARLYAELGRELASRDISVEVYFFRGDPLRCWRKRRREALSLSRLRNLYPGYRLLIVGAGEALLDEDGRSLAAWTEDFDAWTERAWLSTRPTEAWGRTEQVLAQRFVVVPANQTGLVQLVQQWQAEEVRPPRDWQKLAYEPDLALGEAATGEIAEDQVPALLTELRAYLGPVGLRWLAACAWYPELYWGLSLRLAKQIERLQPPGEDLRLDLDSLIRLFRLPWLRQGRLPRRLREALASELPEAQAQSVRALLLDLLQEPANLPPGDSYAAVDHQVRLALFTYLNSGQTPADQARLRQQIGALDPDEIEDRLSVQELGKVPSPLALLLPARWFRGQIPLFGLRQRVRLLGLGLPLLLACLGSLGLTRWQDSRQPYEPQRSYLAAELNLSSPADSARWLTHEGYLAGSDPVDTLATGAPHFTQALALVPGDSLAAYNLALARYAQGRQAYRQDSFAQALDTLRLGWAQVEARLGAGHRARAWLLAQLGTTSLLRMDLSAGATYLRQALCQPSPLDDSLPPLRLLSEQPVLRALLQLRQAQDSSGGLDSLLRCLGLYVAPPLRYVYVQVLDEASGQPLPAARLLVPQGPVVQADASGHLRYRLPADAPDQETLDWEIEAPGYGRRAYSLRLLADSTQVQTLRLRPNPGNLRASLRDTLGCAPFTATMTAAADKPVSEYTWYLAAGPTLGSGSEAQLSHTFAEAGRYQVNLAVRYRDGGRDTLFAALRLRVQTGPQAAFTYAAQPDKPLQVAFTAAPGGATTYRWDFGDGSSSSAASPAHTYAQAGSYTVRLIAANACGADTATQNLTTQNPAPQNPSTQNPSTQNPSTSKPILPTLVRIAGGTFEMGDVLGDNEQNDEKPVHTVTLRSFELAAKELSFAEYDAFCEATGREKPDDRGWGRGDRPVIYISWYDAVAYCNWLSGEAGYRPVYQIDGNSVTADWSANGYRLPTEAEWEYAAREGGKQVRFGNGQDLADPAQMNFNASGSYKKPYSVVGEYRQRTVPVGSFAPNALGLYDMSGNVWEWCWDWYGGYSEAAQTDPRGPQQGSNRVGRGGGWFDNPVLCRVALRLSGDPGSRGSYLGFRLARSF